MSKKLRETRQEEYIACDWCSKEIGDIQDSLFTTWPTFGNTKSRGALNTFKSVWANWFGKVTHHFHAECVDKILRSAVESKAA